MAQLSPRAKRRRERKRRSIRITAANEQPLQRAQEWLEAHYDDLAADWAAIPPEKREEILAHSPLLARCIEFWRQFVEVEPWLP